MKARDDDPCRLPARVLAQRVARRQLTAVEVLEAHLARIEKHNPVLCAVVSLDVERARREARQADAELRRGKPRGPLHGVPMTLKDGHDVAGLRTTAGTAALDRVAAADGTVAARLRAAGAILMGHTNVPPWLGDYQSANPIFGRTANPWDTGRTAGGSSGGAAAALAAGLTPLEIGTDLAGSARLPAHFCGVYGLKVTEGRVPLTGFFRPPDGVPRLVRIMSCAGPMARDLGDLELALRIVAGPDDRDGEVPPVALPARRRRRLRGLRLAVTSLPGARVETAIQRRVARVAAQARKAGARVSDRLPDVDWKAAHTLFGDLVTTVVGLFDPRAQLRDEQRTLAWYLAALERRDRLLTAWQDFFQDVDALILPAAMTVAFTHRDTGSRLDVDGASSSYWGHGRLLGPWNLTGLPALAVPAGLDEQGLPIGLQIVGPLWSEMGLLDVAREMEREGILPGFQAPPL